MKVRGEEDVGMPNMQPHLTVITLGVRDIAASAKFYEALGFIRKVRATGDEVAFFDAGGMILALWAWHLLADDARMPEEPRPAAFRGSTLGWNCASNAAVDAALAQAVAVGANVLKQPQPTPWGGYAGYFADPDGHPWEVVHAPMFPLGADGALQLPD
jgi:predicted lactoylglutathione lyase